MCVCVRVCKGRSVWSERSGVSGFWGECRWVSVCVCVLGSVPSCYPVTGVGEIHLGGDARVGKKSGNSKHFSSLGSISSSIHSLLTQLQILR